MDGYQSRCFMETMSRLGNSRELNEGEKSLRTPRPGQRLSHVKVPTERPSVVSLRGTRRLAHRQYLLLCLGIDAADYSSGNHR